MNVFSDLSKRKLFDGMILLNFNRVIQTWGIQFGKNWRWNRQTFKTEQIPANIDSNSIARRVGGNAVKQILWRILHNIQQLCKDWDDLYIKRETRSEKTLLLLFYLLIVLSPFIFISAEGCPYQPPARISIALCQEHWLSWHWVLLCWSSNTVFLSPLHFPSVKFVVEGTKAGLFVISLSHHKKTTILQLGRKFWCSSCSCRFWFC